MKNGMILIVVALAAVAIWAWTKGTAKAGMRPPAPVTPSGAIKAPAQESPSISLSVWQGLTGEQISALPVTTQMGNVGAENYYKTSQPVLIGDTGFKIWGVTESGAIVISQNDPSFYDPIDWY